MPKLTPLLASCLVHNSLIQAIGEHSTVFWTQKDENIPHLWESATILRKIHLR